MRVLIVPDQMDGLPARDVGAGLAAGWQGHDVVTIPVGEAGAGWLQSAADMMGAELSLLPASDSLAMMARAGTELAVGVQPTAAPQVPEGEAVPIDPGASSHALGAALAAALGETPEVETVMLDLGGLRNHDAGAGLFAGLGARADGDLTAGALPLSRLTAVDLQPVRELLGTRRLIAVVPSGELGAHLLGLRGITSIAGRESGMPPEQMLAIDGSLEHFVGLVDPAPAAQAGAGACGGLGWAVRALGGELTTGPDLAIERHGLATLAAQADLVVTACSSYDFASRGGGVVAAMAQLAAENLSPCVVFGGQVLIGLREMRTMGVEEAYPIFADGPGEDPAATLRAVVTRVAGSWKW